jgi:hypothetical protein
LKPLIFCRSVLVSSHPSHPYVIMARNASYIVIRHARCHQVCARTVGKQAVPIAPSQHGAALHLYLAAGFHPDTVAVLAYHLALSQNQPPANGLQHRVIRPIPSPQTQPLQLQHLAMLRLYQVPGPLFPQHGLGHAPRLAYDLH